MTAAATAAAGEQDTSVQDETQDVEDTAAADQGDDTSRGDSDASDEEDWKAKYEAQQRINRNLERRTKRDKARIEELEGTKKPAPVKDVKAGDDKADSEIDVEKIRAEARAEAAKEALQERVLDKIEAKAKDFADPADAVAMLMRGHTVDDFLDGDKLDVDAIQDALKDLLEKKPYLGAAAQGGKQQRFQGSAEGGAKPTKPARPQSLDEAVRRRLTPK